MQNKIAFIALFSIAALCAFGLTAKANADPDNDNSIQITSPTATPQKVTGTSAKLSVTATGANISYKWTQTDGKKAEFSSDTDPAPEVTFKRAGIYWFFVTVTSADTGDVKTSDPVKVTVVQSPSITVSPAAYTMTVNSSEQLKSTIVDQFGNDYPGRVDWTYPQNACFDVDGSELVTAGDRPCSSTVTAKLDDDKEVKATATITVTKASQTKLNASATLDSDKARSAILLINPQDGAGNPIDLRDPAWKQVSSKPLSKIFTGGPSPVATFSHAGMYTFEVTVWTPAGDELNDRATVTVPQNPTRIVVKPDSTVVQLGGSQTFKASVFDQFDDAMPADVSWSCDMGSVDPSGVFQAGNASGTATITASSGNAEASTVATIPPAPQAAVAPVVKPETPPAQPVDNSPTEGGNPLLETCLADEIKFEKALKNDANFPKDRVLKWEQDADTAVSANPTSFEAYLQLAQAATYSNSNAANLSEAATARTAMDSALQLTKNTGNVEVYRTALAVYGEVGLADAGEMTMAALQAAGDPKLSEPDFEALCKQIPADAFGKPILTKAITRYLTPVRSSLEDYKTTANPQDLTDCTKCEIIVKVDSNNAEAHLLLGECYSAQQKPGAAQLEYNLAIFANGDANISKQAKQGLKSLQDAAAAAKKSSTKPKATPPTATATPKTGDSQSPPDTGDALTPPSSSDSLLDVKDHKPRHRDYQVGDSYDFTVNSKQAGYLAVLESAPNSNISVIYPPGQTTLVAIPANFSGEIGGNGAYGQNADFPDAGTYTFWFVYADAPINLKTLVDDPDPDVEFTIGRLARRKSAHANVTSKTYNVNDSGN